MARYKDSFEELFGFSRSMDRMLSSILLQDSGNPPAMWRPPTDVYETQGDVVILVEVAGMDPDKIQVEFSDRILRISGRREDKHRRAACHCLEVQYGEFTSEVYLPGQYDLEAIDAEYKDGFLTITLPKFKLEARLISVQAEAEKQEPFGMEQKPEK
jgi:HSP20 family protein